MTPPRTARRALAHGIGLVGTVAALTLADHTAGLGALGADHVALAGVLALAQAALAWADDHRRRRPHTVARPRRGT